METTAHCMPLCMKLAFSRLSITNTDMNSMITSAAPLPHIFIKLIQFVAFIRVADAVFTQL